jgi:hypothetical protein
MFLFILWSQDELYSRVKSYFGEEKFKDLENSFVIVRVAFLWYGADLIFL